MARTGRPVKPTVLHKLEGTTRSYHASRADPEAVGDLAHKPAPEWMTEAQKELWAEVLLDAPKNLLRRIDWVVFANYIEIVDRHAKAVQAQRKLDEGQPLPFLVKHKDGPGISPYIRVINHCVLIMRNLQGEMGFTPQARARFKVPDSREPNVDEGTGWELLRSLRVVEGGRKD
jgi:P27 family predicted phage terminase small subunit